MKRNSPIPILASAVLWMVCTLAAAAEVDLNVLRACAGEKDDARRLACYDRAVGEVASEPPAVAMPERAVQPTMADKFGSRGGELARKQARDEQKVQLKQVSARIAAMGSRPRGERVFTLDNGQVWVEKRRASYLPVEVGDVISITAGALGAFRLSEASGRSTQVQRIE